MHNVEKDRTHKDLTGLYEEIQSVRRDMEASAATGRTMKSTRAWEKLMKSYRLDVKVNNVIIATFTEDDIVDHFPESLMLRILSVLYLERRDLNFS